MWHLSSQAKSSTSIQLQQLVELQSPLRLLGMGAAQRGRHFQHAHLHEVGGLTALMLAAQRCHSAVLKLIVAACPSVCLDAVDESGMSALMIAVRTHCPRVQHCMCLSVCLHALC
jgi:hypothetical protein